MKIYFKVTLGHLPHGCDCLSLLLKINKLLNIENEFTYLPLFPMQSQNQSSLVQRSLQKQNQNSFTQTQAKVSLLIGGHDQVFLPALDECGVTCGSTKHATSITESEEKIARFPKISKQEGS